MSGSSLDGLDIVLVEFKKTETWSYIIQHAQCFDYPSAFRTQLQNILNLNVFELARLNKEIGIITANFINQFLDSNKIDRNLITCIASHGQTLVHQPQKGYTLQIGCASTIAALTKINVVSDFRTKDIALGGQGAPMVPIGEKHLFSEYKTFLNIGGISNISIHSPDKILGFDCSPANTLLNFLAQKIGHQYDKNGDFARNGKLDNQLLAQLNNDNYYQQLPPKSLGTEYISKYFFPLFENYTPIEDALHTATHHIAKQIAACIPTNLPLDEKILVTGGGSHNQFLIEQIQLHTKLHLVVPNKTITDFKEALIIGFAGLLRILEQPNFLKSVTGASKDSVGGAIYLWY